MDIKPNSKIYFIGIGGIAMSATAGIAKQLGFDVSGSDSKSVYDPAKQVLEDNDIPYHVGYKADQVANSKADLYIASSGEGLENPEIAYLEEQGKKMYSFSELLYELSKDKLRVVVTGTHGKSTIAGMLGRVLQEIDDSSFMTGAVLQQDEVNFHQGDGHYYVFEGDEYKALYNNPTPKFHLYKPDITILSNLELDHPDLFSSLKELEGEFEELLTNMPDDGLLVYNADSASLVKLAHRSNLGQVTFSLEHDAHFRATEISIHHEHTSFTVQRTDPANELSKTTEQYHIALFGDYNVANALAVVATLRTLGFSKEQVQNGLNAYHGVKRRLEFLGETKAGVKVFDDYAHHPTAVLETLKGLRARFPEQTIWAVFEPHTFSRTAAVLDELAVSFNNADQVLISEIYPAREKSSEHSITGEKVVTEITQHNPYTRLVSDKEQALEILQTELKSGDIVVVMAVGNFNTLGYSLVEE